MGLWLGKVALTFVVCTIAGVMALCAYVAYGAGPNVGYREVWHGRFQLVPLQLVFVGLPTVVMLCLVYVIARRSSRRWIARPLALLFTFWAPVLLVLVMADTVDVVFAWLVQLVVCLTLPLPQPKAMAVPDDEARTQPSPGA